MLLDYYKVAALLAFERYGFHAAIAKHWAGLAPELARLVHDVRDEEFANAIADHLCTYTGRAPVLVALRSRIFGPPFASVTTNFQAFSV